MILKAPRAIPGLAPVAIPDLGPLGEVKQQPHQPLA